MIKRNALAPMAAILTVILSTAAVTTVAGTDEPRQHDRRIHITDDDRIIIITHDFRLTLVGEITFSPDDSQILSMTPGSRLELKHKGKGEQLRVERGSDGQPLVDNPTLLAELLPELLRETAINAAPRIKHRLAADGFEGVMSYIDSTQNEHAAAHYLEELVKQHQVNEAQWRQALAKLSRFDKDDARADVLVALYLQGRRLQLPTSTLDSLIDDIKSVHYRAELITEVLEHHQITSEEFARLYRHIPSAHYQAELVQHYVQRTPALSAVEIHDLIRGIKGNHYKGETYLALLPRLTEQSDTLKEIVLALDSDHYRAEIVHHWLQNHGNSDAAIINAIRYIDSDHYRSQLLQELLARQTGQPERTEKILSQLPALVSDHWQGEIIEQLIRQEPFPARLSQAIARSIDDVDNDRTREALRDALSRRQ